MPVLYLIPSPLSDNGLNHIPQVSIDAIEACECFVVERARTARRFIKGLIPNFDIDAHEFIEIDKHGEEYLAQVRIIFGKGINTGLISEAGLPAIADPGSIIVNLAREYTYEIRPLTGPSSILMALMSSGLNGQQFCFHGYMPIKEMELKLKLIEIQSAIKLDSYSHIFIETPYRNQQLLNFLIKILDENLTLSISIDLTGSSEATISKPIREWKDFLFEGKIPACFVLGKLAS